MFPIQNGLLKPEKKKSQYEIWKVDRKLFLSITLVTNLIVIVNNVEIYLGFT